MPIKQKRPPNRGRRAAPVTLSAPTGGLNGRDSFTDMPPNDAFQLDNWFPNLTSVDTRGGSLTYSTGLPAAVESLEVYTGAAGSQLLAFSDGAVYNATAGGAIGSSLISGLNSNLSTSCMFSNAGAQFLLMYTGADAPMSYDGTTLNALTITGLNAGTTQDQIFSGQAFKGRMFLAQYGQLGFYYLAVGAIQGAASYFDLSQQSILGGTLATITAVSQTNDGVGPQDYTLFVTSEGEYILYGGTDPSNAATWSLIGRYYGPPPIGKKAWFKFRSDVYFITEEGVMSFSQIVQTAEEGLDTESITAKLGRQYTDAAIYDTTQGWCGFIYPRGQALMVNVPLALNTDGGYQQFVMNTNSNAWCRYLKWDALCWGLFNRRAYFGTIDGRIVLADEGFTDDGAQVQAVGRQAWNTFDNDQGMGDADKQFHFATLAMQADGAPAIALSLNTNYEDDQPIYLTDVVGSTGAEWDIATWDVDEWAGGPGTRTITIPIGKLGYIASLWMQAASSVSGIRWFATRIILEISKEVLLQ